MIPGGLAFGILFLGISDFAPLHPARVAVETAGIAMFDAMYLVTGICLSLLYFEGRHVLEADFLKFAPVEITGERDDSGAPSSEES